MSALGDEVVRQIRVLEPGKWSLWRRGERWLGFVSGRNHQPARYSNGSDGLQQAERANEQAAAVANCQPQHLACTTPGRPGSQHSQHVAALPILVLKGFDDQDNEIGLSANSAILMGTDGDASYVEPASSAFQSQQEFVSELEHQMQNLGLSTLFSQKMGA